MPSANRHQIYRDIPNQEKAIAKLRETDLSGTIVRNNHTERGTGDDLIAHFHHRPFHQRTWNLGFPEECRDGAVSDHTMNHASSSTSIDTELVDLCIKQIPHTA